MKKLILFLALVTTSCVVTWDEKGFYPYPAMTVSRPNNMCVNRCVQETCPYVHTSCWSSCAGTCQ